MSLSSTATLFLSLVAMTFIVMTMRRYLGLRKQQAAYVPGRLARLAQRLRDPQWRKFGGVLLVGKLAGLAVLAVVVYYINPGLFGHKVFAADPILRGNGQCEPGKHRMDIGRSLPGVRNAGWFHHAGGGLLPLA